MIQRWIIPCNPKYYDIIGHFECNTRIIWKRSGLIRKDDVVYFYVGRPYSEIKYRCHVIDDDVSDDTKEKNRAVVPREYLHNFNCIMMELDCVYPTGALGLNNLKAHGLGQVQRQARVFDDLIEYIESKEPKVIQEGE